MSGARIANPVGFLHSELSLSAYGSSLHEGCKAVQLKPENLSRTDSDFPNTRPQTSPEPRCFRPWENPGRGYVVR